MKPTCPAFDHTVKILIIDDEQTRHDAIIKYCNHSYPNDKLEFISAYHGQDGLDKLILDKNVDMIFLDNDMGIDKMEGIDFIKHFVKLNVSREVMVFIHTMNPITARRIANHLNDYDYGVCMISFDNILRILNHHTKKETT